MLRGLRLSSTQRQSQPEPASQPAAPSPPAVLPGAWHLRLCNLGRPDRAARGREMEGVSSSAAGGSSSAAAVQGGRGREPGPGRVGATNIGRLRQGKQQHAMRPGVGAISVTSWHLRVFAAVVAFMGCLLLAASLAMSALHQVQFRNAAISRNFRGLQVSSSFFLSLSLSLSVFFPGQDYLLGRLLWLW